MSGMYGANVEQLGRAASEFGKNGAKLDDIAGTVSSALHSSPWYGPGADRYRQVWESVDRKAVMAAADTLKEIARQLIAEANAQVDASSGGAGGGVAEAVTSGLRRLVSQANEILQIDEVRDLLSLLFDDLAVPLSIYDLFAVNPYEGNFAIAESIADGLAILGGTVASVGLIMLIPPATPAGFVVLGVGTIIGGVGMGIDLALKTPELYREIQETWPMVKSLYNDVSPWVGHQWDVAYEHGSEFVSNATSAVAEGADEARDALVQSAGYAKDAVAEGVEDAKDAVLKGAEDVAEGVQQSVSQGWKKFKGIF